MNKRELLLITLLLTIFATLKVVGVEAEGLVASQAIAFAPLALGVSAGLSGLKGLFQNVQARKLERQNIRPNYQISGEVFQNQALAQQRMKEGLPAQVYNNQLGQMQQNFATGLRSLNSRGNTAYNVNSMLRNMNQGVANLNAQDANARQQGTQMLMNANSTLANERRQQFNINQLQPYQQNAQNIANMRRAGDQNMFGALNMLAQGAMMGTFGNGTSTARQNVANVNTSGITPTSVTGLSNPNINIPSIGAVTNPFTNLWGNSRGMIG